MSSKNLISPALGLSQFVSNSTLPDLDKTSTDDFMSLPLLLPLRRPKHGRILFSVNGVGRQEGTSHGTLKLLRDPIHVYYQPVVVPLSSESLWQGGPMMFICNRRKIQGITLSSHFNFGPRVRSSISRTLRPGCYWSLVCFHKLSLLKMDII